MTPHRFGLTFLLAGFLALLGAGAHAHAQPAVVPGDATQTVQSAAQRVMKEVETRRAEFEADPHSLHEFVAAQMLDLMDRERATRLVLGMHARSAQPSEIDRFGMALARNLAARYGKVLLEINLNAPLVVVSETEMPRGEG